MSPLINYFLFTLISAVNCFSFPEIYRPKDFHPVKVPLCQILALKKSQFDSKFVLVL